jgi:tRNA G18 (ribose-2'-O)-methylase SpoU
VWGVGVGTNYAIIIENIRRVNNILIVFAHIFCLTDGMTTPIGVGPHPRPWPTASQFDPELLRAGDTRNVEDQYRYWSVEAIKNDLATKRHDVHVAIENWQHDLNIGTIVRNANAFNASAVHIIGKRHWNRRGAMVTDRYLDIYHHASVDAFVEAVKGRSVIAIDNLPGAVPLSQTVLPGRAVLVFGGEGPGLSKEMRDASESMVMIEQFGSTRSVNVGVASGIVLYEWTRRHILAKNKRT